MALKIFLEVLGLLSKILFHIQMASLTIINVKIFWKR
jgi:hypothetical protein